MIKILIYEFQDMRYASRARKEAFSLSKDCEVYLIGYNASVKKKRVSLFNNLTVIEFPLFFASNSVFILKSLNILLLNFKIGLFIITSKADIYFMHNLKLFFPTIISLMINKGKLVYDTHELQIAKRPNFSMKQKLLTKYDYLKELFLIRRADLIIQASEERSIFFSRFYKTSRPLVIENHSVFENTSEIKNLSIREQCGLLPNEKLIIFTGNISIGGNQRIDNVIKSLKWTAQNVHLAILGNGQQSTKEKLLKIAENCDLSARVHFLQPVLSEKVVSYINGADIAVIPIYGIALNSRFSALNKVSQSLMAGLPIVCSNYLNLNNLVIHNEVGKVGELFNVMDPENIANAINICLAQDNYTIFKNNSLILAKKRINWNTQEDKLLAAIEALVSK